MKKYSLRHMRKSFFKKTGDYFKISPRITKLQNTDTAKKRRVLVIGVVLANRKNHYKHISSILGNSSFHEVHQVWAMLKSKEQFNDTKYITHKYFDDFIPRSSLINSILADVDDGSYDYIMITDDDIRLPKSFLDQFLIVQERLDFSIAQPARTANSVISHAITIQQKGMLARETLFVEIGPFVSVRKDMHPVLFPLDTGSPMGWGLDYVWPKLVQERGKKMGIIDNTPVAHTLRGVSQNYDYKKAAMEMKKYLESRGHLKEEEAHVTIEKYSV